MQIVIELPEDKYKAIVEKYDTFPKEMKEWGLNAIKNGIPLPKGHGDLIDVDNITGITLEDSLYCLTWEKDSEIDCYLVAPTIIPAEKEE